MLIFRVFREQLGGRCIARDLFVITNEFNHGRPDDLVKMEVLGACVQLVHLTDLDPEWMTTKKRRSGQFSQKLRQIG